jgi:hypothetical protein
MHTFVCVRGCVYVCKTAVGECIHTLVKGGKFHTHTHTHTHTHIHKKLGSNGW